MSVIADDIKAYIDERDGATEARIKAWLTRTVLAQFVGLSIFLGPMIFYLGGIHADVRAMADAQRVQAAELNQRGQWMQEREKWELALEQWAIANGYVPPRYRAERSGRGL